MKTMWHGPGKPIGLWAKSFLLMEQSLVVLCRNANEYAGVAAAAGFFGLEASEAVGQSCDVLFSEASEEFSKIEAETLERGEARFGICSEVIVESGNTVRLSRHAIPYQHDDGEQGMFVVKN